MANVHLSLVTPDTVNRTVMPRRLTNAELRTREHLTGNEVEATNRPASLMKGRRRKGRSRAGSAPRPVACVLGAPRL
jgi:hypothetical protein